MGRGAPCRPIGGSGVGVTVDAFDPVSGRACGVGVRASANFTGLAAPTSIAPVEGGGDPPFFSPDFRVMGLTPADALVKSIHVEETSGYDLPVCRVALANVDRSLSSTLLAKEQTSFQLSLGWTNPGLEAHGTFIVQRPRFRFEGSASGKAEVEIVAYGEQVKLAATERREVYRKMRDSDIAKRIAERNGFEADVDQTDPVHDQVIQANESDYKFLARRAKLHGFVLMVEDGVMKFHTPRPCDSGVRLTCSEAGADINNFVNFRVQSRTLLRGARLRLNQVNPITKEEFDITSGERSDDMQRELDFDNWADLVTIPGVGRPERFVMNEGHEQRREQLRDQVDRMAESLRYVVSGAGDAVGLESLRPQQIIRLDNIGRSSGRYITTRVSHKISGGPKGGFSTRFEVVRAGASKLEGQLPDGSLAITQPESAGSVFGSTAAQAALAGF